MRILIFTCGATMEKSTGRFLHLWFEQGIIKLLTGEQTKVLMTILEKITCSKHRESLTDRISISQFTAATKLCRSTVISALKIFREAKLIAVGNTNHKGRQYKLLGGEFDLAKLQQKSTEKVKRKSVAVYPIDRQQSIPQTGLPDRLPEQIMDLRVAKNTRAVYPVDTPDIVTNNKRRYNAFSDYFFKEMGEAKDKVAKCLEIVKRNSGELEKKLNTFYDVLSWLRGAGAESEVEQSWRWHWKVVNRMPREYIWDNVIQANLRERLLTGTIRNVGAAYADAIKKLADEKCISLEPKRGMAKAEPANEKIRKVA